MSPYLEDRSTRRGSDEHVIYTGHPRRDPPGPCRVEVIDQDHDEVRALSPRHDLVNHSPTGFAWGYQGSGCAQLAFALLMDATRDEAMARAYYQDFKRAVVSRWHKDRGWSIKRAFIVDWLGRKRRETLKERLG